MVAKKVILFVEGEPNSPNGDLRQGLTKLLEQKLKGKMPKIIIGGGYLQGGKSQTIRKFKTNKLEGDMFLLLVDLDKPESEIEVDLADNDLIADQENVFYMIQEMESWFLSQPQVLDAFYGANVSDKIPKKKPTEIANPDEELIKITKNSKRGQYHKIRHAVELLKLLDATKLENDFSDFRRLIAKLNWKS
jgi:Domain of unknown function (DUF4276)